MPIKIFGNKCKIKRPNDVIKMNVVFDVSSKEYSTMSFIDDENATKLTFHNIYDNIFLYDIIYKADVTNTFYSINRTKELKKAKKNFLILSQVLNVLGKEICLSHRTNNAESIALENAVKYIFKFPNWLLIHFAARLKLSSYFKNLKFKNEIIDNLDSQCLPLKRTPIMLAIISSNIETVRSILEYSPNLNLLDKRGNNVLHFASVNFYKLWNVVMKYCICTGQLKLLLSQYNNKFVTPIHFACYSKNYENFISLLKHGLTIKELTIEPPFVIEERLKNVEEKNLNKVNNELETDQNLDNEFLKRTDESEKEEKCIVYFTAEMISDLKIDDIMYGGTPLHWCQYKRTLERLIQYKFNVNVHDLNHETAIMKCIKDNRFKCLVILLNAGADPSLTNTKGNTSLHEAVICRDIAAVQACICWDVKLDLKNKAGETARHIASIKKTIDHQMIVNILHNVGAKRCEELFENCLSDCSFDGQTNGIKYSKWPNFETEIPYSPFLNQKIIDEKLDEITIKLNEDKNEKENRKVKMICFDGGGTKGLITVQVLIELEKKLKRPINEYFEWMSGTSTGSFICAMLALNIPLRNIKVIYYMLKDKIMIGPRPYDSKLLEKLLKSILGENVCMGQISKKIIITGTLADRTPCQLHLFRSYPSPNEILNMHDISLEKVLNQKKDLENNSSKMLCLDPHIIVIELSTILSKHKKRKKPQENVKKFNDNELNEHLSISVKRKKDNKNSKNNIKNFFNTNTTLSEFTENLNEINVDDAHTTRLKFFHIPNYSDQKLWRACRSSGAAPTFFRASGPFIDGGIISNNPVLDSLTDFVNYNCALEQRSYLDFTEELELVLSIGTGKSPVIPNEVIDIGNLYSFNFIEPYQSAVQTLNLAQEILSMATQTDAHVVKRAQAWCNSMQVAYFRLNPPLSENLQLNEIEEVEIVNALWETKAYMYNQRSFIETLAKLLERHSMMST